jgi:acyl carrier protein
MQIYPDNAPSDKAIEQAWNETPALSGTALTILAGLAAILEVPSLEPESVLGETGGAAWDSLAIVCTIALLDEKLGLEVSGEALVKCETAGDVLKLAGVA